MADWFTHTVRDVITKMKDGEIVLPVIQRHFVWTEDKMELLFDSLFRKNSFGSITCIEEESGRRPLFAHRLFSPYAKRETSSYPERLDHTLLFVVDGQQRLQSFYTGLCGTHDGRTMYYDLFSDCKNYKYNFRFALSEDKLQSAKKNEDENTERKCLWYSAPSLFAQLKDMETTRNVAKNIADEKCIVMSDEIRQIEDAVRDFYDRIFKDNSVGLSKVVAHLYGDDDIGNDRQRITEMFRRLNDGATKLSQYDLVAVSLKSFNDKMDIFLDDITGENEDIGFDQDTLIKLLLILNDRPNKTMMDIEKNDADFAVMNLERIRSTLDTLKKFLRASNHYEWFSSSNKSAIPLYILAYHIFYHYGGNNSLQYLFSNSAGTNFSGMLSWLKLSLLNQIFKRGCGWIPETTGIKMMYEIMKRNRGKNFPADELLKMHKRRLNRFIDADNIAPDTLDSFNQEYIFYLIYGGVRSAIRFDEKEHIQPFSLLEEARVRSHRIDSIGNLILIDKKSESDKTAPNDKELCTWLPDFEYQERIYHMALNPGEYKIVDYRQIQQFSTRTATSYCRQNQIQPLTHNKKRRASHNTRRNQLSNESHSPSPVSSQSPLQPPCWRNIHTSTQAQARESHQACLPLWLASRLTRL
ncbi:MAG: DUF262 domain-containing protein [Synergistaceae bacterium]|nr:DUF262 domain-containing protein [Synergistaceae bacterium]